ncbi:MAG: HD domain-containing protein [Asgard group archaeon]|nr:HD domain-containing protein [Asgard group archaeon]
MPSFEIDLLNLYLNENQLQILKIVEKELSKDPSHTLDHIMRVYKIAMLLATSEQGVDINILKTAILLHDIARLKEDIDNTGKTDHAIIGAKMAEKILTELKYPSDEIKKIKHCISTHRFRGNNEPQTIEAKILFDADKIDLLGAIGIARIFMIAGKYNQKSYSSQPIDLYIKENLVDGKSNGRIKVKSKHAPNIEFKTKIANIPNKLFTQKAKEIAKEKIKFMELFFNQLENDISVDFK